MSSFSDFNLLPRLEQAIAKLNFTTPTPVQIQAIPLALEGKDIIASAQTGSGKTAAYCIPMLTLLLKEESARALVLVPTRELVGQISRVIEDFMPGVAAFRPALLIGGVSFGPQLRDLRRGARIIIATPGRLIDHLRTTPRMLDSVRMLVLDEADRMLDMGFAPQLEEVRKKMSGTRQTMLFSATYPSDIQELAAKWTQNAQRVSVGSVVRPVASVEQQVIELQEGNKRSTVLSELEKRTGSVIIFTRTKRRADQLLRALTDTGVAASQIHGGRSQQQRERALAGFRSGHFRALVATDIAARGIDVPEIEHVINYDLPFVAEDYLHRIGRTGRAGRSGKALCLVAPHERALWRSIERLMARQGGRSSREQREESQSLRRESAPKRNDFQQGRGEGRGEWRGPRNDSRSAAGEQGGAARKPYYPRDAAQQQDSQPRRFSRGAPAAQGSTGRSYGNSFGHAAGGRGGRPAGQGARFAGAGARNSGQGARTGGFRSARTDSSR